MRVRNTYTNTADLKLFNYTPPMKHHNVVFLEDRVVCTKTIPISTIVTACRPVLSYTKRSDEDTKNLLLALGSLPAEDLATTAHNLLGTFPRDKAGITKAFKARYFRKTLANMSVIEQIMLQSEHVIVMYCTYNEFNVDDRRFLYAEGSRFNHSCESNCEWTISDNTLYVKTIKEILEGEELTISYMQGTTIEDSMLRRNILIRHFGFYCQCTKCKSRCNGCNKRCNTLLACSKCKVVGYCSTECQASDWQQHFPYEFYHKELCSYLNK